MARNGSGVYTTPNTFVAGTTITAAPFNQDFSDIASELTNSVAADGQTTMTGPLKASSGTVALPSLAFASDTDTGFYRSASNEISAAAGGAQVAAFSSAGVDAKAGKLLEAGNQIVPAGVIFDYAGTTVPSGWLPCDGAAVSRTTYATLFSVISTTYGAGNGSTTFNVPDARGRVLAGLDTGTPASRLTGLSMTPDGTTIAATGGTQTIVQTSAQLAAHTHGVVGTSGGTSNDHTHNYGSANAGGPSGGGTLITAGTSNATSGQSADHTHSINITSASSGSSNAMLVVQPTLIVTKMIKT